MPALKSSNSCSQLITLGRCEPRCRAEEMLGQMRTWEGSRDGGRQFVLRAAKRLPASAGCKRQRVLGEVMGCKCS